MLNWFKHLFKWDEDTRAPDEFMGFACYHLGRENKPMYFKPRRTKIAGKRPETIAANEICYNVADDEFYVGMGDNKFKTYKCE